MGIENLDIMRASEEKMLWHEAKQAAIAKNIAEVDTPNYKARDVKKMDFSNLLAKTNSHSGSGVSINTTNPAHMTLSSTLGNGGNFKETEDKKTFETTPTGNTVSVEDQMSKMSENYVDHRLTTTIYQKNLEALAKVTK